MRFITSLVVYDPVACGVLDILLRFGLNKLCNEVSDCRPIRTVARGVCTVRAMYTLERFPIH
jgi:hypothetical protein